MIIPTKRVYFIGFRKFKKIDQKKRFNITTKKGINEMVEFFDFVDCDLKNVKSILYQISKDKMLSSCFPVQLSNVFVKYYLGYNNKKNISLSSIKPRITKI